MKDKATKIYLIGTWRDFGPFGQMVGMRVVGYYTDLETAKQCVEENWGDIYEDGYYHYAVIEDAEPGLYKTCMSKPLFYNWKDGKYTKIKRPKALKNNFGFTIG